MKHTHALLSTALIASLANAAALPTTCYKNANAIYPVLTCANFTHSGDANATSELGGSFSYNRVEFSNAVFTENDTTLEEGNIYGAFSNNALTQQNEVKLNNVSSEFGSAFGALSLAGSAEKNSVALGFGSNLTGVFGGASYALGSANSNAVNLTNSTALSVYGGYSEGGFANSNSVFATNSVLEGQVAGGVGNAEANLNRVEVSGGASQQGANFYGGLTNLEGKIARDNFVKLNNFEFGFGGSVIGGNSVSAVANKVEVSNANSLRRLEIVGGAATSSANANTISVKNLTLSGSGSANIIGGRVQSGSATSNVVNVEGDITGSATIYGGFVEEAGVRNLASHNTININTAANLSNTTIIGGYAGGVAANAADNTLNINANGVVVQKIDSVTNLNIKVGNQTALTVLNSSQNWLANSNLILTFSNTTASPKLITINNLISAQDSAISSVTINNGSYSYTLPYKTTLANLRLDTRGFTDSFLEGEKALLEASLVGVSSVAKLGGLSFLTLGKIASKDKELKSDFTAATLAYEKLKAKTGSSITTNLAHFNFAAAKYTKSEAIYGVFLELSKGSFESENEINTKQISGEGSLSNFGAGLFAKGYFGGNNAVSLVLRAGFNSLSDFEVKTNAKSEAIADLKRNYYGASVEFSHTFELSSTEKIPLPAQTPNEAFTQPSAQEAFEPRVTQGAQEVAQEVASEALSEAAKPSFTDALASLFGKKSAPKQESEKLKKIATKQAVTYATQQAAKAVTAKNAAKKARFTTKKVPSDNTLELYARASALQLQGKSVQVDGLDYDLDGVTSLAAQAGVRYNKRVSQFFDAQFTLGYEQEFSATAEGKNIFFAYNIGENFGGKPSLKGGSVIVEAGFSYEEGSVIVELKGGGAFGKNQGFNAAANVKYKF